MNGSQPPGPPRPPHPPPRPRLPLPPAGPDSGSPGSRDRHAGRGRHAAAVRRRRKGLRRLAIAVGILIVVIAAIAGGAYAWFAHEVGAANDRVDDATRAALAADPVDPLVAIPQPPGGLNILLLGSDSRLPGDPGRADTFILVHVDTEQNFLSLLSVPRDLYVNVPGHGEQRINASYAYGGSALAIQTVKQLTGLDIDKYVEVDFQAFKDIVDSVGGVYLDVDRLYDDKPFYPHNEWEIHLSPGYQLLDGENALCWARYRFDGNLDFGRMARQQRLITAMKEQTINWSLPTKLPRLVRSAFANIATNLSSSEVLSLAYWFTKLDGSRVRQIIVTGKTARIDDRSVVSVSPESLETALTQFVNPPDDRAGQAVTTTTTTTNGDPGATPTSELAPPPDSGTWTRLRAAVPFELERPGYLPAGFKYYQSNPTEPGTYDIAVGDKTKPAIKVVYKLKDKDLYLGVGATTWTDAPLASEGEEVEENGVTYTIVGSSNRVDHIWWKKGNVLYYISNTLMYSVSRAELLRMAQSMVDVPYPK